MSGDDDCSGDCVLSGGFCVCSRKDTGNNRNCFGSDMSCDVGCDDTGRVGFCDGMGSFGGCVVNGDCSGGYVPGGNRSEKSNFCSCCENRCDVVSSPQRSPNPEIGGSASGKAAFSFYLTSLL